MFKIDGDGSTAELPCQSVSPCSGRSPAHFPSPGICINITKKLRPLLMCFKKQCPGILFKIVRKAM